MTNLYQTSSGTPVTADGQPVGLVLDKSQDGALGSELVTNGTFDSADGWTGVASTPDSRWYISNGTLTKGGINGVAEQIENPYVASKTYLVQFDVIAIPNGNVSIGIGDATHQFTSTGTQSVFLSPTNLSSSLRFVTGGNGGADVVIDNISVKEVLGNHAVQPTASSRPTYNANPDRLTLDLVDDGLLVDIPTGGWDGYMTVGTDLGTATYGVSLPEGNYELGGDYFFGNTINNVLFREGEMQPAHRQAIEQIFVDEGAKASYGDVTDFSQFWRQKNLTEFPLIDTSSATSFYYAWGQNDLIEFPLLDSSNVTTFSRAWQSNNLTSFPLLDTSKVTNFYFAWFDNNLTSFPLIDTSSGTNFSYAWRDNNLTSFPALDFSSATNLFRAWERNNLTSFPLINTSNVTNFSDTWARNNLTSFPLIDTSSGTNFGYTWQTNQLTSFPALDLSNGGFFRATWRSNANLTDFPANMFDNCGATNFDQAFTNTNLSQESIDGILVSIESNGTSNGTFDQSGGSAPSATGESAITALRARGWTITVTGGF